MQQASRAGEGDKGRKVWNCVQPLLQHKGLIHSTKANFASQKVARTSSQAEGGDKTATG